MRTTVLLALASLCMAGSTIAQTPATRPASTILPVDPLTATEIRTAVSLVKAHRDMPSGALFPIVALQEPSNEEVRAFKPGGSFSRRALVVVLDRERSIVRGGGGPSRESGRVVRAVRERSAADH